jgi:hypothetical protein
MTDNSDGGISNTRDLYLKALVPVLAFGGTILGIIFWNVGILNEIQYAAAGGFLASCLLAYLAWLRPRKDIVSLTTPVYGFIFMVTPIDYIGGVTLQLLYAGGLTVLVIRLHFRFGVAEVSSGNELTAGPHRNYVESTRDAFTALDPVTGRSAAEAFVRFSEGDYRKAADLSHAAVLHDGIPGPVIRAFGILRQHAELLEKNLPRPVTYLKFLPDDAALMAKPVPAADDTDREFDTMMDNALLLLYSAAWNASKEDRGLLLASQEFAKKLLES